MGLVRVEDGEIVHELDQLVQPPQNQYSRNNINVHGIYPEDTLNSPTFDDVWYLMKDYIDYEIVVAHNSGFDVNCLKSALAYYDLAQPQFEERCTRKIFRRGLAYLSKKYKIPLNHHDALSDARACAMLYIRHLRHLDLPQTGDLFPDF